MTDTSRINEITSLIREDLKEQREAVRQVHNRQLAGPQVCAKLATINDTVIRRLMDMSLSLLSKAEADTLWSNIALVGLGSYGRRQCAPYSDVDLMILHGAKRSEEIAVQLRPLTQGIFDVGLQLGHSVRTESEAIQLARDDAVICTSLIEARFLMGSQPLFESFRGNFKKMAQRNARNLARIFFESRATERDQYGETVYLLEPHVKRSRGGTRDMNLICWLGFLDHGIADPDRLHTEGVISKLDHHRLRSARDFLLRLRNEMHFHAGKARDLLDRAEQMRVADWHGHTKRANLLPVEHFMRDYFRHTNHIWQMVRRREVRSLATSRVSRVLEPVLSKNINGDYRVGLKTVSATESGQAKLKSDLGEVLRFVQLAVSSEKTIDHTAWSMLFMAAPDISERMTDEVKAEFFDLLGNSKTVGEFLRVLHELGFLEKVIPAVRHARFLLQFNQYHKYTVDEHCLRAVRKAAAFEQRDDVLGTAYREIQDKRVLHLALLLHDLGKGFEEDHSDVGKRIAEEMCDLLGLDQESRDDIVLLVHKHLVMSHLTFRRDTSDLRLIKAFAEEMGSPERLRMLFVLTCADLAAVGPGVLNDWKTEVLASVFERSVLVLEQDDESVALELVSRRERIRDLLAKEEQSDLDMVQKIEEMPPSFLASTEDAEVIETLRRFRNLPPTTGKAWGAYHAPTKTMRFTCGVDQGSGRGIFSSMAGVLSSAGLEILSASTDLLPGRFLMLRYTVASPPQGPETTSEWIEDICQSMVDSIDSEEPPRFPKVWGQDKVEASTKLTALPNEVRVDNKLSQEYTIIEVFTFDRVGLLYKLARKLHNLKLVIAHAKIGTYLDQVVDVFYVTDQEGNRVVDEERIGTVRAELLELVEQS